MMEVVHQMLINLTLGKIHLFFSKKKIVYVVIFIMGLISEDMGFYFGLERLSSDVIILLRSLVHLSLEVVPN